MTQYRLPLLVLARTGKNVGGNSGEDGMARGVNTNSPPVCSAEPASTLAVFQRQLVHDAEREGDFSVAMQRKAALVNFYACAKNFHNLADFRTMSM